MRIGAGPSLTERMDRGHASPLPLDGVMARAAPQPWMRGAVVLVHPIGSPEVGGSC